MRDPGFLCIEGFGCEQVQLCARRFAASLQRIKRGHARLGRVGLFFVRLLAFGARVDLRHAIGPAGLHFPIHSLRESFCGLGSGMGSREGVNANLRSPR